MTATEWMTDEEVEALLRKEDWTPPPGPPMVAWRISTPAGPRYFRARDIDAAMSIANTIPDAGFPERA
jgi:hypothetical protein